MNLAEASGHFGVREWGRYAPLAVRILRDCTENDQGCWVRRTFIKNTGYSIVFDKYTQGPVTAHRAMYRLMVGGIPVGLDLDHLCHGADVTCLGGITCTHRHCVNPSHMEPVTERENTRRGMSAAGVNAAKTHCQNGHEFTPDNTFEVRALVHDRVGRGCRICRREYLRAYRAGYRARAA